MSSDPYEVMGLSPQADEAAVRRRYLELVREFPPDRAPERFAEIRAAYDELRDPVRRVAMQLFSTATDDSLDALAADLRARLLDARPTLAEILALAEAR